MDTTAVANRLRKFEGVIPWMYLDGGGIPTTGVGHALPGVEWAQVLPWSVEVGTLGNVTIALEYEIVRTAKPDEPASFYSGLTRCRLSDAAISKILADDMESREAVLTGRLPDWAAWPDPVQQATFDMAFNLGVSGLLRYPLMIAAIRRGEWKTAAEQSHRRDVSDQRNSEIAALILSAGVNPIDASV